MKIKVCGLKNKKDVLFCAYEGVDALGFFVSNEDKNALSLDEAKHLISSVPPFTASVLVTDATSASAIISMVYYATPTAIQLQENISVDEIIKIRRGVPCCWLIKTVYVDNQEDLSNMQNYSNLVDLVLIDIKTNNLPYENELKKIVQEIKIPIMFSEKIYEICKNFALVYCVDVKESVENQDSSKDYEKISNLVKKIKKYNAVTYDNKICVVKRNLYSFVSSCNIR